MKNYEFFIDGSDYQDKYLHLINSARQSIIIQTYIFEYDIFGQKVADALLKKAAEGITIDILIDYFGSFYFPKELQAEFEQTKGIHFYFFNPVKFKKLLQMGRRLHHKILLVDNKQAMLGGININDYREPPCPDHPRLDFAILLNDEIVNHLTTYCLCVLNPIVKKSLTTKKIKQITRKEDDISLKINDWFRDRKQITSSYMELITNAKQEILLIHGYFFPSFRILRNLKKKARQGLRVTLILPKHSDWQTWVWASNYLYYNLIKENISIMEWEQSNLHGKLALFDNKIVTLGSHNLNYTSSYGNLELNIEIHNKEFVQSIKKDFIKNIIAASRVITADEFLSQGLLKKIRNAFFSYALLLISSFSISIIKFSRRVNEMSLLSLIMMLLLFFIGLVGIILPVLPGFPFLLAAIALYMKKGSTLKDK